MNSFSGPDGLAEAHASLAYVSMVYDWDWSGAEKEFHRAIDLNSNYATAHEWYAELLAARGRRSEALEEMKHARDGYGHRVRRGEGGNPASARKALEQLKEQSRSRYVPALYSAALYRSLGDSKNGIALLKQASKERSDYLIFLNVDPMADSLRGTPSFQALLGQIGLTK